MNITQAQTDCMYRIVGIDAPEPLESRLSAMGFSQGSLVAIIKRTLGHQTYAVRIDDGTVALRAEEAAGIRIHLHHAP